MIIATSSAISISRPPFVWYSVRFLHICSLVGSSPAVQHVNRSKIRIFIFRPHSRPAILFVLALCFENNQQRYTILITSQNVKLVWALMSVIWPANHNQPEKIAYRGCTNNMAAFSWGQNIVCQLVAKNVCLTGKARAMGSNLDHTHTGCLLILLCERPTVQATQPGLEKN